MKQMNLAMPRSSAQGFSLIEIIVVITIIGVIVGWAANNIFGKADQAQAKIGKSKIVALSGPLDIYKLDTGKYPTTQEGLKALLTVPSGVPIVERDGRLAGIITRVSLGADGQEGGDGANRDLKSWE